jgi:hypothetical protein
VSWNRAPVTAALAFMLTNATEGAVTIHERPPETLNPPAVVIHRPTVAYSVAGLGIDEVSLPLVIVGGIESEAAIDALKETCRQAVLADQTLGGTVQVGYPTEERNWRNYTGAGGIQILQVELVLTIQM